MSRTASSVASTSGRSEHAAGCSSLTHSSSGRSGSAARTCGEGVVQAAPRRVAGRAGRPRGRRRASAAASRRARRARRSARRRGRAGSARPRPSPARALGAPVPARRRPAPRRCRAAARGPRGPTHGRGGAAPRRRPPTRRPSRRHRDPLLDADPHGVAVPAGGQPEAGDRVLHEVVALHAGATDLVAAVGPGLQAQLVGQRHRLHDRHQLVAPILAHRPEEEADVDLGRRPVSSLMRRAPSAPRRRAALPARAVRRARRGMAERDERLADAVAHPASPPCELRASAASALRRWAKAPWTSAPEPRAAARARALQATSTESTLGTGWKTVRGTARPDAARRRRAGRARDGTP